MEPSRKYNFNYVYNINLPKMLEYTVRLVPQKTPKIVYYVGITPSHTSRPPLEPSYSFASGSFHIYKIQTE